MTEVREPVEGDSAMAAPVEADSAMAAPFQDADDESDEVVRTTSRSRPSTLVLLVAAILVVVIVQVVMTFLTLGVAREARDQTTVANGLQRCLIQAQLNENSATDTSGAAYRSAVQSCLTK